MRQTGDVEFRAFYERLGTRGVGAARRLVRDQAAAEDIAAEAFARAFARWNKVRNHPNPDAWVMRVIGNLAIDHLRREARRPELSVDPATSDSAADGATLHVDLASALGSLSSRQQEVVVLRYLIDLTEEDVASSLGVSTGSVKTHLHRATTKLRADLVESDAAQILGSAGVETTDPGATDG